MKRHEINSEIETVVAEAERNDLRVMGHIIKWVIGAITVGLFFYGLYTGHWS